jgi:hypothetical protein
VDLLSDECALYVKTVKFADVKFGNPTSFGGLANIVGDRQSCSSLTLGV